jgi:predicted TIM-barrel fold metal-dependent hydrolase
MTGVLDRFPDLKLALIETSLGWMPYLAEQMDNIWLRHRWLSDETKLSRMPSEYLRSSIYANFDREYLGVNYREFIGVDKILFGTDFPHIGSFYPHSRFFLQLVMRGVPEKEQEMMLWSNAASLYGVN